MKRFILAALVACATLAFAGPDDMLVTKRNSTDNGTELLIVPHPVTPGFLTFNPTSPTFTTMGDGLMLSSGVLALSAQPVNADWNSVSGLSQILNKPSIPAAQVNADWNATNGVAAILNKPSIPAAQINADWAASSGISAILNKPNFAPVAISGNYNDLTNKPTIPTVGTFNFSAPVARTFVVSTAYQASDTTKAAIVTASPSCTNATTVVASSACTIQVRQSATSGLTCSTGTVSMTWTSTVQLGLVFTQTSGSPFDVKVPAGHYFIFCATAGTFSLSAVEQSAG